VDGVQKKWMASAGFPKHHSSTAFTLTPNHFKRNEKILTVVNFSPSPLQNHANHRLRNFNLPRNSFLLIPFLFHRYNNSPSLHLHSIPQSPPTFPQFHVDQDYPPSQSTPHLTTPRTMSARPPLIVHFMRSPRHTPGLR
jgi:hypothetical protein